MNSNRILKNCKKNGIAVVLNENSSIIVTTTDVLTVWFYSVFGEKLSGIIKSLDKGKYITATMTKKNVKQQIIFNLLKLSDLGNLC